MTRYVVQSLRTIFIHMITQWLLKSSKSGRNWIEWEIFEKLWPWFWFLFYCLYVFAASMKFSIISSTTVLQCLTVRVNTLYPPLGVVQSFSFFISTPVLRFWSFLLFLSSNFLSNKSSVNFHSRKNEKMKKWKNNEKIIPNFCEKRV